MSKVDERMEQVKEALDDFEKSCALFTPTPPGAAERLQEFLMLSKEQLEKMSAVDLGMVAYELASYAFYLQRMENIERSRITWAEASLRTTVAQTWGDYDKFTKAEIKTELIAKENSVVRRLLDIIKLAQQRIDRLNGLVNNIRHLTSTLKMIQMAKTANFYKAQGDE